MVAGVEEEEHGMLACRACIRPDFLSFQMLSVRLEELLVQEQQIVSMVTDEAKQRQLLLEDEDEDFLDEGSKEICAKCRKRNPSFPFFFSERKSERQWMSNGAKTRELSSPPRDHDLFARMLPDFAKAKSGAGEIFGVLGRRGTRVRQRKEVVHGGTVPRGGTVALVDRCLAGGRVNEPGDDVDSALNGHGRHAYGTASSAHRVFLSLGRPGF